MNLTEGQLLFRLQDFHGAEQEALGIGDYEFFQESADIANALRELLQARRTIEELTAVVGQRNGECVRLHSLLDAAEKRIAELEKGHQEAAKQINSWRRLAKQNIAERGKDISELEAARQRIAELEARAVNLPKRSVDEVMHLSGFSRDYAEGWCAGNDNAIHEIRAAGIKVKGA